MGFIIPADVFVTGVRNHADFSAQLPLPPDDGVHPGVGGRDMIADIGFPPFKFIHQLLFRKTVPPAAHFRKAQMIAAFGVFPERHSGSGTEFIEDICKIGIIDGLFTLDNGIIVVQHQAWVFQHTAFLRC